MTITPLRDIVLIKADPAKTQSASGLYIQEEWKSLPPLGEVIAVGPDVKTIKAGDRVIFGRYGTVIMENDLRLCKENQVHAKTA